MHVSKTPKTMIDFNKPKNKHMLTVELYDLIKLNES